MSFDHILVIGFGGPRSREEIRPFLDEVARGVQIPQARLREVERHYEQIGGSSPYHSYTLQLIKKLNARLRELKINLPLLLGMRNWRPFLKDTLIEIDKMGLENGIGIVLAPHRSDASFEKYVRSLDEAKKITQADHVRYDYLKPWFDHPFFVKAQADQARGVLTASTPDMRKKPHLLFTAHSIPLEMASACRYADEFRKSSELVAKELGGLEWSIAYQSRSGAPKDPWLEPDVGSELKKIKRDGKETVLLVPIGFLCDNAEVLYDLDIEARKTAEESGLRYLRARTVMDHPAFVEMFAELIEEKLCGS